MLRVLFLHLLYLPINNGVTPLCLALTHVHKCCNIYVTNPLNATWLCLIFDVLRITWCVRCRCEEAGGSRAGAGAWPGGVCCCSARRQTRGSSRGSPMNPRRRPPSSARRSCCHVGLSTRSECSSGRATTSASATRGSCTPSSGTAWLAPTRKVRTPKVLLGLACRLEVLLKRSYWMRSTENQSFSSDIGMLLLCHWSAIKFYLCPG